MIITTLYTFLDFYYWRDYYGEVPPDAFEAGLDGEGKPTYVGTTYFLDKNHLLPTIIIKNNPLAYLYVGKDKWGVEGKTKVREKKVFENFISKIYKI